MYATPKIYDDIAVVEPKISMYKVKPIYDDISLPGGDDVTWARDLEARQDKCLTELELLQQRVYKLEADCCGAKAAENTSKMDIVIGCSVGSPAVYMAAVIARKVNCLIKVFSHSSNTKEVDSGVTNKLLCVNNGETDYCGINLIYKDTPTPHFMACPGRQVAVSGLSNILRYVVRERKYTALYDEEDLESAALIDEILSLVDSLEQRAHGSASEVGQILNNLAKYLQSSPYLAGDSFSIADIALCCTLTSLDTKLIPNSLRSYLVNTIRSNYEMRVLKAFLNWIPGEC